MRLLLSSLPLLGCAGAMVACARMMRGPGGGKEPTEQARRISELEEEVGRLRGQIAASPDLDASVRE